MDNFWKRLKKWFDRNQTLIEIGKAENFIFDDTTVLDAGIAAVIWYEHINYKNLIDDYDKEFDYNRLLRMENSALNEQLISLQDMLDDQMDSFHLFDIEDNDDSKNGLPS